MSIGIIRRKRIIANSSGDFPILSAGSGGGGGGPNTLDPASANATLVLSGGNMVMSSGFAGEGENVRSIVSHAGGSGKFYFEVLRGSGAGFDVGIVNGSFPTGNHSTYIGENTNGIGSFDDGNIYYNNGSVGTQVWPAVSSGDYMQVAVDLSGGSPKIWFARGGDAGTVWNNTAVASSNPATGVGGISIPFSGPYYAALEAEQVGATLTFRVAGFSGTIPSGFSAW